MTMRSILTAALISLLFLPCAWSQGNPLGPEFRVNTYTTGQQDTPSAASDPAGNFVTVWAGYGPGEADRGIFGQRYADPGAPAGPQFHVNSYATNAQNAPRVASDGSGGFVVVWDSAGQDGSGRGIFAQRYAASGPPLGPEFRVNTYTPGDQFMAVVGAAPGGSFVVVWTSPFQDGSSNGVFGQRYDGSGTPLGTEFRVNSHTTNAQVEPALAVDTLGNFVVVWASDQDGSSFGIFGQRYAASGAPLGPEFRVNTFTTGPQRLPSVTADPSGGFVVVWELYPITIDGQRYASSGAPAGPEFTINTYPMSYPRRPSVAGDASGNFVVSWTDVLGLDGSGAGVFARRYAAGGSPLSPEFVVNSYVTNSQQDCSVAADALGRFVVVWSSAGQDGSQTGVFAQRFAPILPVELEHFTIE